MSGCTRKRHYPTYQSAVREMLRMQSNGRYEDGRKKKVELRIYFHKICNSFHLTSEMKRR